MIYTVICDIKKLGHKFIMDNLQNTLGSIKKI